MIIQAPLASRKFAFLLSLESVSVNGAVKELSFVNVDVEDGEYQNDDTNDQHDIGNTSDRANERIDNELHADVVRQESKRSKSSEHSEDFEGLQVLPLQSHVENRGHDNEEVHLVPSISQVGVFVHAHSHCNKFHQHLEDEKVVECRVQVFRNFVSKVFSLALMEECVVSKLNGGQGDEDNDDSLPKWVLDHFVGKNTDWVIFGKDVE